MVQNVGKGGDSERQEHAWYEGFKHVLEKVSTLRTQRACEVRGFKNLAALRPAAGLRVAPFCIPRTSHFLGDSDKRLFSGDAHNGTGKKRVIAVIFFCCTYNTVSTAVSQFIIIT
jgi:hypothetical protein